MKELQAQSLVVETVRARGGFAMKLAHKFLIGIPDLLVQIPGYGTSLWEVKMNKCVAIGDQITLHLTDKQAKSLRDFSRAGGECGVISFLECRQGFFVAVSRKHTVYMPSSKYFLMERGKREEVIYEHLIGELK